MKTMKRLLALLLALSMVMPNCLTIASAYSEEIAEEVVEELVEEIVETPEEVVEEVFEEEIDEEWIEEEEVFEEILEEEVIEEILVSDDVANEAAAPETVFFTYSLPEAEDDSEELFAAYANSVLYPDQQIAFFGSTAKWNLDGAALELYDALEEQIIAVANGADSEGNPCTHTQFQVTIQNTPDNAALNLAIDALLADMPYYLYWYDKVTGVIMGGYSDEAGWHLTVSMAVASAYADGTLTTFEFEDGSSVSWYCDTDGAMTSAAIRAAEYAAQIAQEAFDAGIAATEMAGGLQEYRTLEVMAAWIINEADYNYEAANGPDNYFSATNSNPWQLIWVFDGDPDTKVVCEGYAKAFQYLCDISPLETLECYSVTGMLSSGTGAGPHMWNVVPLDGRNYLVDLTNCDSRWEAFLVGVSGGEVQGTLQYTDGTTENYTTLQYTTEEGLTYLYDKETVDTYGAYDPQNDYTDLSKLKLSDRDYEYPNGEYPDLKNYDPGLSPAPEPDPEEPTDPAPEEPTEPDGEFTMTQEEFEAALAAGSDYYLRDSVRITRDMTVESFLSICDGGKLVVESGATLTFDHWSEISDGELILDGGNLVLNTELVVYAPVYGTSTLDVSNGTLSCYNMGFVTKHYGDSAVVLGNIEKDDFKLWSYAYNDDDLAELVNLDYQDTYGSHVININGNVTLSVDAVLPELVQIFSGCTLTVCADVTNDYTIEIYENASLVIADGYILHNNGTINNAGTFEGSWDGDGSLNTVTPGGGDDYVPEVYTEESLQEALNSGMGSVTLANDLTITGTLTIPYNMGLTVACGYTLTIAEGATLVNAGTLYTNNGIIRVEGTLSNGGYVNLDPYGTSGELIITGTVINNNHMSLMSGTTKCTGDYQGSGGVQADIRADVSGIPVNFLVARVSTEEKLRDALDTLADAEGYSGRSALIDDDIELTDDLVIPNGINVELGFIRYNDQPWPQYGLTIPEDVTVTNNGYFYVAEHTYLYLYGTVENNGGMTVAGTYINEGLVTGNQVEVMEPTPPAEYIYTQEELEAKLSEMDANGGSYEFYGDVTLEDDLSFGITDWENGICTEMSIYGTLTVPSGVTLTIGGNCYIYGGNLIVEEGGKLVLKDEAYLSRNSGNLLVYGELVLPEYNLINNYPGNWGTMEGVPASKQRATTFITNAAGLRSAAKNADGFGQITIVPQNDISLDQDLTIGETVQLNLSWSSGGTVEFNIPSGVTLTIDSFMYIGSWAQLNIQPGGKLIVNGSVNNEGTVVNNGTLINNGNWNGNEPETGDEPVVPDEPDYPVYTAESLAAALASSVSGDTIVLNNNVTFSTDTMTVYYIPEGVTLEIAEGATLTVGENSRLHVGGDLVINGTLENYCAMEVQTEAASVVNNGHYLHGGNAEFWVRYFSDESMSRIDGIMESQMKLFYNGSDASMLKTLAGWCGLGAPNLCKGEYAGYKVNVEGTMTISEYTDIHAIGSLGFAPGATLVIENGAMLYNMGTIYVRNDATVIVNKRAELANFGAFDTSTGSVISNYGVMSNNGNPNAASFGYMNLIGTYNHGGTLYLNATGTQWGKILGNYQDKVTLNSMIGADWDDETALATLKAAKDSGYSMTQIWLEGDRTFTEHLALITPVELHICGTLNQNAPITLDNSGASLIVEEGATLNVNNNEEKQHSLTVLGGNTVTVNGTLNSNAPLHLGLDNSAATLNVAGTLNNNAYLNICENAAVNITGTLNQNAYDESTGLGGIIIENHGDFTVEDTGTMNVRFDVINAGAITNNGTVRVYAPASVSGEGNWEGNAPVYEGGIDPSEEYTPESLQAALNAASAGEPVTLKNDLYLGSQILTIPEDVTLIVDENVTLWIDGNFLINNGELVINGTVNQQRDLFNNHLIIVNGELNVNEGKLHQDNTVLVSGLVSAYSTIDNNGRTVLQSTENGGGTMNVYGGGRLDLIDGGKFLVEPGAVLRNGNLDENYNVIDNSNGDVRIRMGTLYVMDDGEIQGPWDGHVTFENGEGTGTTEDHLSAWSLNNPDGDGWYLELDWGENWSHRMLPGSENWFVVYENIWHADEENADYWWERNPIGPEVLDAADLHIERIEDMDGENIAEGQNSFWFLHVTAGENWDVDTGLTYNGMTYPIYIGRDLVHGYYSAPEAANENWVEAIEVNNLAQPIQDHVVYYMVTADGEYMTGNFEIHTDDPDDYGIYGEYIGNNTIKITIPADTIRGIQDWIFIETEAELVDEYDNHIGSRRYGTDIRPMDVGSLEHNAWMRLNDRDLNYNAEYDVWFAHTPDGPQILDLAEMGLSYDYESNTLTMNNAHLESLEVGYYGWDENGRNDSWYDMPSQNLTIELVGENSIVSYTDSALKAFRGVKLEITGDGSLYLAAHHGDEGFHNEDYTEFWEGSAIAIGNEESSLTISGNARVTAEVSGKAYYMENGEKRDGNIRTIGGHYGSSTLTVRDNAQLTTIVPEGAVHNNFADPADGYTGGYRGIADFVEITVADNAQLRTQDLDIRDGAFTQTGGTTWITALGYVDYHQEREGVRHTHFNGIRAENSTIDISGGTFGVTIPENIGTESHWYQGIAMNGGTLNISGDAWIDLASRGEGTGIHLDNAYDEEGRIIGHPVMNMTGGQLIFNGQEIQMTNEEGGTYYVLPTAIWTSGESEANITAGEITAYDMYFEFNGTTVWGTEDESAEGPRLYGEEVRFVAGGPSFTINSGSFDLRGSNVSTESPVIALFDAAGMVTINGGNIYISDGVFAVETGTTLNDGYISVSNDDQMEGLWVSNYFAINGGELDVSVPGSSFVNDLGETINRPAAWIDGTLHQMGGFVNIRSDSTEAIHNYGSVMVNGGTMSLNGKTAMVSDYSESGWFFVSQNKTDVPTYVRMFGQEAGLVASSSVEIVGGNVYVTAFGEDAVAIKLDAARDEDGNIIMVPDSPEDPMTHLAVIDGKLSASASKGTAILAEDAPIIIHGGEDGSKPEVVLTGKTALQTITSGTDIGVRSEYPFMNMNGDILEFAGIEKDGKYVNTLVDGEAPNLVPATNARAAFVLTQENFAEELFEHKARGQEFILDQNFTITDDTVIDTWFTIPYNVTLTIAEGATLTVTTEDFINYGVIVVDGELIVDGSIRNNSQIDIYGNMNISGKMDNDLGYYSIFNGATIHVYEGGRLHADGSWNGYAPMVDEGATVTGTATFYSQLRLENDLRALTHEGIALAVGVPFTMEWNMTTTGTLIINNTFTVPEGMTLTIPEGATLVVNGKLINNGTVNALGTVTVNGTVEGNEIIGTAPEKSPEQIAVEESLAAGGLTYLESDLTIAGTLTIPGNAGLIVPAGFTLTIPEGADLVINGFMGISDGTVNVAGQLTNNGSLEMAFSYGASQLNITGSLVNNKFLKLLNGTVVCTGTYTGSNNATVTGGIYADISGIPFSDLRAMAVTEEELIEALAVLSEAEEYPIRVVMINENIELTKDLEIPAGITIHVGYNANRDPYGLTVPYGMKLTNNGTITVLSVACMNVYGELINNGEIDVMGTVLNQNGNFVNNPGSYLTITSGATFTNAGGLDLSGTTDIQGSLVNWAVIYMTDDSAVLTTSGSGKLTNHSNMDISAMGAQLLFHEGGYVQGQTRWELEPGVVETYPGSLNLMFYQGGGHATVTNVAYNLINLWYNGADQNVFREMETYTASNGYNGYGWNVTGSVTLEGDLNIGQKDSVAVIYGNTMTVNGNLVNDGTLRTYAARDNGEEQMEASAIVIAKGYTLTNNGTVHNNGSVTLPNSGSMLGSGTWNGNVPVYAIVEYTPESLQAALNAASTGATVTLKHFLALGTQILTIPENVTLEIAAGGELCIDGNFLTNNGTLTVNGTLRQSRDLFNNGLILVNDTMMIHEGKLHQNGTLLISGYLNLMGIMDTNGRTVVQSGSSMNIMDGGKLDLVDRGQFHVESGAWLENFSGEIRVRMGTLYVMDGGNFGGDCNGNITWEGNTDDYLSYWWFNRGPEGFYVNIENNNENRNEIRIWPGYSQGMVFCKNEWISSGEDYYWQRTPVVPEIDCDYLTLGYLADNPNNTFVDGEPAHAMVEIRAENNMDALDTSGELRCGNLTLPVYIGRDLEKGYYSAPEASNETWMETIMVNNLKEPIEDMVFYFIVTAPDVTMSGNYILNTGLANVAVTYEGDNIYKIVIPADTIRNMQGNMHFDFRGEVDRTSGDSNYSHYGIGTNIQTINANNIRNDVWMEINGSNYNYSSEYDVWSVDTMNGRVFTDLPAGMSYDFATNTLTLDNARLSELEFGYYDWDGQNISYDWTFLPNENLTLNLVGENVIECNAGSAMRIARGVKMNITGDGSLHLKTNNGDGVWDEWEQRWIAWSALDLCLPGAELTISGNAKVTAEITGGNYRSDPGQEKQHGGVSAISGNYEERTLTVKDNAVLTTVIPENTLRWDDINGTGGYNGISGFSDIIVNDSATLNTQYIGIGEGSFTQTGGTVNITAQANLMMTEKWQWNEQTQQDEMVGMVEHTHYDGIHTNGGNVTITGGALNITIPDKFTTDSSWYRGISMDSGNLTIGGDAVVTIDGPANRGGNGIELSCAYGENGPVEGTFATFNMNGGKLVMKEALFDNYDLTRAIWSDNNAVINIDGGEWELDAVVVELNGKTTWNDGVVNAEEIDFIAGGEQFVINGGEFNLTGVPIEGNDEIFSNALFRAAGMVAMNGGTINIVNGILGVPTAFELNGGSVSVNNDEAMAETLGMHVGNYMAINGGTLDVHVVGGSYTFEDGSTEVYPAVQVLGTLHQMGGTVSFSSENTEAIKSFGSVLLNSGEMNLSGTHGIRQLYNEDNPDGMFFVNGGVLNIEATDIGIFANNSPVAFVQGENGENPEVSINAAGAAIQLLTDGEDSLFTSDYTLVNNNYERLAMNSRYHEEEGAEPCYIHTLMDGDAYAKYAQLKKIPSISQADFEAAMQAAVERGEGEFWLSNDVTITSDLTLPITVRIHQGAEMTIASGATLTAANGYSLDAKGSGRVTVLEGGRIVNNGSQMINSGGNFSFYHGENYPAYVEENGGDFVVHPIRVPGENGNLVLAYGVTVGWAPKDMTLEMTIDSLDAYHEAIGFAKNIGFGATVIDIWNSIVLDTALTIPENVTVIFNNSDTESTQLRVVEGGILAIDKATSEGAVNGSLFINNGAVLDVQSGGIVNNNGQLHIGNWQNGSFANSGVMEVQNGATVNLRGYTCIHNFEHHNGSNTSFIPGMMMIMGTVNAYEDGYIQNSGDLYIQPNGILNSGGLFTVDGQTTVFPGGTLNNTGILTVQDEKSGRARLGVSGTMTNKGQLNIFDIVSVDGTLDNDSGIFMASDTASLTATGTVTNSASISTEATKSTIDFSKGTYTQDSQTLEDGTVIYGELISDYFADGTANVKTGDMSKVTLRYVGENSDAAITMTEKAEAEGYGNFILAVDGNMTLDWGQELTITDGSYLTVKPGSELTTNATVTNNGTIYIGATEDAAGSWTIRGEIANNGTILAEIGSIVNNEGTIRNSVDAALAVNGSYTHDGWIYNTVDSSGKTAEVTGNILDYQIGYKAVIDKTTADPEATLRTLVGMNSNLEVFLYDGVEVHITENMEIPYNVSIFVGGGTEQGTATLILDEKVELVNNGYIDIAPDSKMIVNGRFISNYLCVNGELEINGALLNIGSLYGNAGAKVINNGTIDNGEYYIDLNGAEYVHGDNAVVMTGCIVRGDYVGIGQTEGIDNGYVTLIQPIRAVFEDHNEDSIRILLSEIENGGYAAGKIMIFDKNVTISNDLTIPENVELIVGMSLAPAWLIVSNGAELTVDGTLTVKEGNHTFFNKGVTTINGALNNSGCVTNESQLDIYGDMFSDGNVYNEVTTHVYGTLTSDTVWEGYAPLNLGGTITGTAFVMDQATLEEALAAAAAGGYPFKLTKNVTLTGNLDVDCELILTEGAELIVPAGKTLTVSGELINQGKLTVDGTLKNEAILENQGEIVVNGALKNYSDLENRGELTVSGTLNNSGTFNDKGALNLDGGTLMGDGDFLGSCGKTLNWKLFGNTLTITGTGAMESTPWNDVTDRMAEVTTIKLSNKMTNILDEAFADCVNVTSAVLVSNSIVEIGDQPFAENVKLKVYHGSVAEDLANEKTYIHNIDPESGDCVYDDCDYNINELNKTVQTAQTTEEKVDAVTSVDTEALKKQIKEEISNDAAGTGSVSEAVKAADQAVKDDGLTVDTQADSVVIDEQQVEIDGAALNASENTDTVTLVVTDADKESIPEVAPEHNESFSKEDSIPVDLTLEGVDDPENLTVPVTITLPIPAYILEILMEMDPAQANWNDYLKIFHHTSNDGLEMIDPKINVDQTVTFVVNSFSTFEFRSIAVAYLGNAENSYAKLATAISDAQPGQTVTMKMPYNGTPIVVDKVMTIDPNGNGLTEDKIQVNKPDLILKKEGDLLKIVAVEAEVNGIKYETLAEALAAAGENGTVKLLRNVTESVSVTQPVTIVRNGFEAKLDLAQTLIFAGTETDDTYRIVIPKAAIGETRYATLADALKAAKEDDIIDLLQDVGDVEIDQAVQIRPNGHDITITTQNGFKWELVGDVIVVERDLFKIISFSITAGDSLNMSFFYNKADLDGTDYYATIRKTYADGREDIVETVPYSEWKTRGDRMYFVFENIAAKEMTDDLYVTIYNGDGTQASYEWSGSVQTYAFLALEKLTGEAYKELHTAMIDMLNYGAGAQKFFNYGEDKLATDGAEEYQKYATQTTTYEKNYVVGENLYSFSLISESKLILRMFFNNITTDMYAHISYTDHYNKRVEYVINGEEFGIRNGRHYVDIGNLSVADGRQMVTCEIKDAEGNLVGSGSVSVESYVALAAATDPVYEKLMKFVDSAYAYFH